MLQMFVWSLSLYNTIEFKVSFFYAKSRTCSFIANKICLVNKKIYNILNEDFCEIEKEKYQKELKFLIEKGILIKDQKEYERLNFLPKYEQRIKERNFNIHTVYFHITQRCNLKCEYCYNRENLNKQEELSTAEVEKVLGILQNLGVRTIILTGGEALLRGDIIQIAQWIKEKGFRLEVLTNGTMLNDRRKILELADSLIISIDTFENRQNLRKGLNIEKLVETLKKVEYPFRKKIYLRSVVSCKDMESWKCVEDFSEKEGYTFLKSIYMPNSKEEIKFVPEIEKLGVQKNKDITTNLSNEICGAGYAEIALDSNGDIYPCQMLVKKEWKLGNIFENKWESSIIKIFKNRNLNDIPICKECEYKYLCGGGCPAVAYNIYKTTETAPTVACNFIKMEIDNKMMRILEENEKNS